MTAPATDNSMLQTLMFLIGEKRERERLALAKKQAETQERATQTEQFNILQRMFQNSVDPKTTFEPHVAELARLTGTSEGLMGSAVRGTAPNIPTQQSVAGQGVMRDPKMQQRAGMAALNIGTPEDVAKGDMFAQMYGDASEFYKSLPEGKRDRVVSSFFLKTTQNMNPGEAALDAEVENLSPEERKQAVLVGKGIAPSASEDAQIRQGWAQLRIQDRRLQMEFEQLGLAALRAKKDPETSGKILELLKERRQLMSEMVKINNTLTPEGAETYRAQLNALNEQLRQLSPDVYGLGDKGKGIRPGTNPLLDIAPGRNLSPTTAGGYFGSYMERNK